MSPKDLADIIRPLMEAARSPHRRHPAAIDERLVRTLATREHVGLRVNERLRALSIFLPDMRVATVLSDGAWVWSLRGHVPSRSPRPRRPVSFCRLDFGLRLDSGSERFSVECRSTVHDADLQILHWESAFETTDWQEFGAWIEKAVVAFAAAYFGGRAAS